MNNYTFGQCTICNKYKVLKNGVCITCNDLTDDMPDFMRDLFTKEKE